MLPAARKAIEAIYHSQTEGCFRFAGMIERDSWGEKGLGESIDLSGMAIASDRHCPRRSVSTRKLSLPHSM